MAIHLLDVGLAFSGLFILWILLRPKKAPLPPGPKGLPILGNIFDMPVDQEWLTFAKWGEEFGGLLSVSVLGSPMIIINSAKIAVEMLDKKSSLYADRPVLQMGGELVGWKNALVLLPYGDRFRRYRRFFHGLIGSNSLMKPYRPMQEQQMRRFLRKVMSDPEQLQEHLRHTAGSIILRISHGYEVQENNDPFVALADKANSEFSIATSPGAFLVDMFPAMRHIPEWFPGAGWKKTAKEWSETVTEVSNRPHNHVKQQLAAGTASVSFSSTLLDRKDVSAEEDFDIKWASLSMYAGGSDTTVSAIYSLYLAMTLFPHVAKKAQEEIDAVVGTDRLPTFDDREHLPYIDALLKEVLRWNAVTPTAAPHVAMKDDIHEGYLIPKGSVIIPNVWKMLHDPEMYPDPMTFKPERFIASEGHKPENDPRQFCFGFGRRICPGQHLADQSIWIGCVMSLAVFDISNYVENGVVNIPIHENTRGTISHPKPFKCTIKPRSDKAASLILME